MENDDDLFRLGLKYFLNRNSEVFQHGGSRVASFVLSHVFSVGKQYTEKTRQICLFGFESCYC